jgi:type IV pilus assembly protein PilX
MGTAMQNSPSRCTLPGRQQGVVLFVALILLLVLTALGVTLARMQMVEERMAGNEDNHQLAFQAAEAALRAAEDDLGTGIYPNAQFAANAGGLYQIWTEPTMTGPPYTSIVNTVNWSDPAATLPYRGPPLAGVPVNAQQPTVVIEMLPAVTIPSCSSGAGSPGSVFRITAHAFGGDGSAQATLQSVYFRC